MLPNLQSLCLGEKGHEKWITGACWLDDTLVSTVASDGNVSLWKIPLDVPTGAKYNNILPLKVSFILNSTSIRHVRQYIK